MIYDHMIKVNGKYYQAGEDVPEIDSGMVEEEIQLPFSDSDIEFEERENSKQYTKTDIKKMKTADLQSLASKVGIENAFQISGEELKDILIEKFGL